MKTHTYCSLSHGHTITNSLLICFRFPTVTPRKCGIHWLPFPGRVFRRSLPKSHANLSFNIYEYLPPATKNLIISCFFPHPVLEYTWLLLNARWRHYNLNTRQPGLLNCHFNLNDIASSVHFRLHARLFTNPGSTYDGWEKVKRTSFCY